MSQRYIGGLIYNPPGGFSGYFDGNGDYLTTPSSANLGLGTGDFTIEFWYLAGSSQGSRTVFLGTDIAYGSNFWGIQLNNASPAITNKINFWCYNMNPSSVTIQGATTVTPNTWYHVALVRSGTALTLYLNGVSDGTATSSASLDGGGAQTITVAKNSTDYYTGYISNLRIVKGTALYTSAFTPPNGPLQAITNTSLLTCAYPTFRDGSSNNFTITVNGNTAVSTQNPFPQTQLPNPALGNQGNGVYSMSQYQALRSQNLWPAIDPWFDYVTLMLHGNGTNGAQNNTFLDSSTNNFTITRNGNTTQGTFTPYGSNWSNYLPGSGSIQYTGVSTALSLPGDFTIEGWYNLANFNNASAGGNPGLIGNGTGNWLLVIPSGQYFFYAGGGVILQSSSVVASANVWNHFAIVRSGSALTLYHNGVSVGTATNSATLSIGSNVTVGSNGTGGIGAITGYISNVRVVKGTAVYTGAFTPPIAPLTAISGTQLLAAQANRFIDSSSNNFSATIETGPSVQRFSPFAPTTPYAAGTIGGSGYFDGSGDYLTTPNGSSFSFGTGDFTIEGWFYLDGNNQGLSDVSGGTTGYWLWLISGGVMYWQNVRNGANLISVSLSNYLSQWVHFAVVRNSGTTRIYQNGVQIASAADTTNYSGTAGDLNIGRESANPSVLKGYMSNFRIVKGTAVYTSAFTPPTTPLTNITNTSLLLSFTNGGIIDNAMMNDLETVGNAQISTSVSKFGGGSLAFDGSGDALALPANINLAMGSGDFTIEMWVNGANNGSTVGGSYPRLFTFGTAQTSGCIECYNAAGTMYIEIFGVSSITFTASTLLNSTWNHYAITRSGTSLRAFVNGTQVGTTATNSTNINLAATTQSWIGAISASAGNFNGYIDDLRITKGYARYTTSFTPQRSQWQDQ